jgi:hypothetical protein
MTKQTEQFLKNYELTDEQKIALERLEERWRREPDEITGSIGCDNCIMVQYGNLWIGIERDGYTHS